MINRAAFFADKEDIESFFGISTFKENIFEPNYNIPAGWQLPTVRYEKAEEQLSIVNKRWGGDAETNSSQTTITKKDAQSLLQKRLAERVILPISGFYVWKDPEQTSHPFFVRMLNLPFMPAAGLYFRERDYVSLVTTESNPLIQPMSAEMPLILDEETSRQWLNPDESTSDVYEASQNLYMLTDLSVLRVSKKVNKLSNNNAKLIQPIPK